MATTKVDVNLIGATGTPGSGNFLRGDGSWQVVSSGMSFISSTDISNAATYDFTAVDASKYDSYEIHTLNLIPVTDAVTLRLLTSTDGGSSYDTGSSDYGWYVDMGAAVSDTSDSEIQITGSTAGYQVGSAAGEDGASFVIYMTAPHLAKETLFHWNGAHIDTYGTIRYTMGAGCRYASEDVDAFRLLFSSGNIESGTVNVYGLANA